MQNTDDYLIQQFLTGDETAFTMLVNRYKRSVFQFILLKVKDRELASDLTQDVFVRLFNSAVLYKPVGKFSSWLIRMAQNICIDFFRKNSKGKILSLDEKIEFEENTRNQLAEQIKEKAADPAAAAEFSELQDHVLNALNLLTEKQQTALMMCQYHGMSYQEIAEVQKCPVGTVKSRIHAAMTQVRDYLKAYDFV